MIMPVLALVCGALFLIGLVVGVMGVDDFGSAMLVGSATILFFTLPVFSESISRQGLINSLLSDDHQAINIMAAANIMVATLSLLRILRRIHSTE